MIAPVNGSLSVLPSWCIGAHFLLMTAASGSSRQTGLLWHRTWCETAVTLVDRSDSSQKRASEMAGPVIYPDSFSLLDVLSLVRWRCGKHQSTVSTKPSASAAIRLLYSADNYFIFKCTICNFCCCVVFTVLQPMLQIKTESKCPPSGLSDLSWTYCDLVIAITSSLQGCETARRI